MQETEDKSPSEEGNEKKPDKDIPEMAIPLSQGLKEYFEHVGMADNIRHTLTMDIQRNLYGKGIWRFHEVFMELEGRIADISNAIRERDDSTLEELIDTIADEMSLDTRTFRYSLISMALKK